MTRDTLYTVFVVCAFVERCNMLVEPRKQGGYRQVGLFSELSPLEVGTKVTFGHDISNWDLYCNPYVPYHHIITCYSIQFVDSG